jgi:GDP-4-dehydro-6-deoxy-D-mannose reductase
MSSTVLITGAAGMVGSHLAERLAADRPGVRILASFHRPTINEAEFHAIPGMEPIPLDVRHFEVVRRLLMAEKPTEIYHLAAQSLPTLSWTNPWDTMEVNVMGTVNLFEAIKSVRADSAPYNPAVVVACSSAAYGDSLRPENVPIGEETILKPLHPYGVSKAAQDMLTYQYAVNDGIRGVRARIFNSTGPRKTRDVVADFAARVAGIAAGGTGEGKLRVGNLETQRAILDVRDLVDALIRLAADGGAGEAYNICADTAVPIGALIPLFEEAAGVRLIPEPDPALMRPSDEAIIFGDTTRLRQATGWRPTMTLAQTVRAVFDYEMAALSRRARG